MKNTIYSIAIVLGIYSQEMEAEEKQPNTVFIMTDDLGWTNLGVMGSDYYETPNIDRLVSQGMFFTSTYASAINSAPSRACLMTGMYTPRHGIFTVSPPVGGDKTKRKLIPIPNTEDVRVDFITMAEALQKCGYQCGYADKWHSGDDKEGAGPLSQGFVFNTVGERAGTPYSYFYPCCNPTKSKYHLGSEEGIPDEYLTDRLTSEVIGFMGEYKEGPFFLYLAHHAVHTPLRVLQHLIEKYEKKTRGKHHTSPVYAAMIESSDRSVGRVCHAIDLLGIANNTVVVFPSGNGDSEPVTGNYPLREGKGALYEGGTRVSLIIRWSDKATPGTTSSIPVTGVDFYPTLVNITNRRSTSDLDGKDLFSLLQKNEYGRNLYWYFLIYLQSYKKSGKNWRATPYSSIRLGDWKLIYYYEDRSVGLFNLKNDLSEEYDLSQTHSDKKKELYIKLMDRPRRTRALIPIQPNPDYIAEK